MIEYLPKTSEQLLGLLYSFGIGLALGFIYELIRFIFLYCQEVIKNSLSQGI